MNRKSQTGVALVITLIMLSLVTFMAVTFLFLSRRERGSVTVATDAQTAKLMAQIAGDRAVAETITRMQARSNLLAYDFTVSTNYVNPLGFQPNGANVASPTNVAYAYANGLRLNAPDQEQSVANLWNFNPRPPVYITTNRQTGANEFRFYLDLNQNGIFEPNGWQPIVDVRGQLVRNGSQVVTNLMVGDPEWIGVLQNPDYPHSSSNLFVGRYAYAVLPMGKSLDLNFMHNRAKGTARTEGYRRGQGVGSWDLNLGAFFRDLNTNSWNTYIYTTNLTLANFGVSFSDAQALLSYRYNNNAIFSDPTKSVRGLYGDLGSNSVRFDGIDDYSVGLTRPADKDRIEQITGSWFWPGSDGLGAFGDIADLAGGAKTTVALQQRVHGLPYLTALNSTYDRYTYYRLLAQMGVDSLPAWKDKIHLNYRNDAGLSPTNFAPWTPLSFFTNTADRLIRTQFSQIYPYVSNDLSIAYIPIYPTNRYSAAIHQLLQLSANIYDASTNRFVTAAAALQRPFLPSVFRPVFKRLTGNEVVISGYAEVTNDVAFRLTRPWHYLTNLTRLAPDDNVYGIPWVVGARKGLPNFNEYSLLTDLQVTRKLELVKPTLNSRPNQTNTMYVMGISNVLGVEGWNSYTGAYPRNLQLRITNRLTMVLSRQNGLNLYTNRWVSGILTNVPANQWPGNQYLLPVYTNRICLTNAIYLNQPPYFQPATIIPPPFARADFLDPTNQLILTIYGGINYIAVDSGANRVVDFVNVDNIVSTINLSRELMGHAGFGGDPTEKMLWNPTQGITNQVQISLGNMAGSESIWTSYSQDPSSGRDKQLAIDLLREYVGLSPLHFQRQDLRPILGTSLVRQTPFNPTRRLVRITSLQVNDPLVHYTLEDLVDRRTAGSNYVQVIKPPQGNAPDSNLGKLNERYQPWGGNPNKDSFADPSAFDLSFKDPLIRRADDWDFPTNKFPTIGWLGRVHRGTPWQTVYLKSTVADTNAWQLWSGRMDTHPTNDWRMLEQFTVAPNDNAARGLLSVNQANLAAWSAVLSGASVLSNTVPSQLGTTNAPAYAEVWIEPNSWQLTNAVPNSRTGIVTGIVRARERQPQRVFPHLGDLLATPELTVRSPYLNLGTPVVGPVSEQQKYGISDAMYERIPMQILSLVKEDAPALVIYAFGQTLTPAPNSRVLSGNFRGLCTNYNITAELDTKTVLRIEPDPQNRNPRGKLRAVVSGFNIIPAE